MRAVIEAHYASGQGRGRKPFVLNALLHVHVAQIVYIYSDPGMEDTRDLTLIKDRQLK
jgi:transposase, IS5 family